MTAKSVLFMDDSLMSFSHYSRQAIAMWLVSGARVGQFKSRRTIETSDMLLLTFPKDVKIFFGHFYVH
jgi:hypothetical protein